MDQLFSFANLFWNLIVQVFVLRCYCKVLGIQNRRMFVVLEMTNLIAAGIIQNLLPEPLMLVRILVLGPVNSLVLPLAFSRGPLVKRVLRTMLVVAGAAVPEFTCAMSYSALTGAYYAPVITEETIIEVSISYLIGIASSALAYEAIIIACGRTEQQLDVTLGLPIISLLSLTYILFGAMTYRFYSLMSTRHFSPVFFCVCLACTILTLALAFFALSVAQYDLKTGAAASDHVAMTRQTKHLQAQIESSAHRRQSLGMLRHDLANQMDTISELLASGHAIEADRHLTELQRRAHLLTGGPRE